MDELGHFLETAKRELSESGSVAPTLLAEGRRRIVVRLLDLPGDAASRRATFFALGQRLAYLEPTRLFLVLDAYMKTAGRDEPAPTESLADDVAATEAITVTSLDRAGQTFTLTCPYERIPRLEGLRIEFGEPQLLESGRSLLLEAFFAGSAEGSE